MNFMKNTLVTVAFLIVAVLAAVIFWPILILPFFSNDPASQYNVYGWLWGGGIAMVGVIIAIYAAIVVKIKWDKMTPAEQAASREDYTARLRAYQIYAHNTHAKGHVCNRDCPNWNEWHS